MRAVTDRTSPLSFLFRLLGLMLLCVTLGRPVYSHPTSFKGSMIFDSQFSDSFRAVGLGWSFSSKAALWAKGAAWWNKSGSLVTHYWPSVNYLLWRGNELDYQSNWYVGLGVSKQGQVLPFTQLDWENREVYFMLDYQGLPGDLGPSFMSRQRIGVAPFLADFDQWSAWLIVENMSMGWEYQELRQILRFYYRNILYEIGGSLRGGWLVNLMVHF
jgi:hypothetical protein